MSNKTDQREFIFLSSDNEEVMAKVRQQVGDFFARNEDTARVISFYEPTRLQLPDMTNIEFWRDLISNEQERSFQLEAHKRLKKLVIDQQQTQEMVLLCNWSLLFLYMYQSVVIDGLMNKQQGPLCLVLSGGGAKGDFLQLSTLLEDPVPAKGLRTPLARVELEENQSEKKEAESSLPATEKNYLLVVEDSGSFLNINPALAICNELRDAKRPPLVLTSSVSVTKAMEKAGVPVTTVTFDSLPPHKMNELQNRAIELVEHMEKVPGLDRVDALFIDTIQAKLHSWLRDVEILQINAEDLFETSNITAMLTIGPPSPLAIVTGQLWRQKKHLWTNYFPALINPSIEDRFFPADRYLVYGTHAKDIVEQTGFEASLIRSVGSTGLDLVFNEKRDKLADRRIIEQLMPAATGQKLVVLGTERRPGELEEVTLILEEIANIPDICVIVKIHPDQSPVPFEKEVARIAPERMKVIHHCDLHALLNGSDLLLCSASNLNLLAAVFETPALVITLAGEPYRVDFPKEGLCMKITKRKEIALTVRALLLDEETRQKALTMYEDAIIRFSQPHDGKTTKRIVQHLVRTGMIDAARELVTKLANRLTKGFKSE